MSFLTQTALEGDAAFQERTRACFTEQSSIYLNDERGDIKALAESLLRGDAAEVTFRRMLAGAPGFADEATNEDGVSVDSSRISDAEILSAVQSQFPTVAALFFASDGTPLETLVTDSI